MRHRYYFLRHLSIFLLLAISLGSSILRAEDTFPNLGKYIADLTLTTRSQGPGTSVRLRNEVGTLFDSFADSFASDRNPNRYASDYEIERSTYGLVNRSQGGLSTGLSIRKVRINEDRTDGITRITMPNRASQRDWLIFRDSRNLEDDTTPFELTVVYTARFRDGNSGTRDGGGEQFSVDFDFEDASGDDSFSHQARLSRRGDGSLDQSGFGADS